MTSSTLVLAELPGLFNCKHAVPCFVGLFFRLRASSDLHFLFPGFIFCGSHQSVLRNVSFVWIGGYYHSNFSRQQRTFRSRQEMACGMLGRGSCNRHTGLGERFSGTWDIQAIYYEILPIKQATAHAAKRCG
ncbi:hypothetical protein RvY_05793 [Ramazzottius varieornatus]|uniref:Uncharacterized protein n=1 Tax=Ramazzottius varieornatus TaxID=947166 RepID=A0A1D1UWA6_RAMVA|nr:hypothetical protein RvY_05793 [Ramazzottius varieornatus]